MLRQFNNICDRGEIVAKFIGVVHGMNVPAVAAGAPSASFPWETGELALVGDAV